eukprot:NODE_1421_length_971_cov_461.542299_g980_i0.p1 GENE.NODE_1421_length_971_cov_461.542299_g980_i0~~NODE_1421_length_971_cov_461.542299_g980_i0.p1  ORF type:complete len:207 (-),score=72.34 NODE_1421_length_971_cov_461.542299_g980_i0:147-767(-)
MTRRDKLFKLAKGMIQRKRTSFKLMRRAVRRKMLDTNIGRHLKKRTVRTFWIQRITAAAFEHGISYPQLVYALSQTAIALDRKSLAKLATSEPLSFRAVVELAREQLLANREAEFETRIAKLKQEIEAVKIEREWIFENQRAKKEMLEKYTAYRETIAKTGARPPGSITEFYGEATKKKASGWWQLRKSKPKSEALEAMAAAKATK